jgi:exodeoxyribonuclease V alpha subunit
LTSPRAQEPSQQQTVVEGHIETLTYYNPDNHYLIAAFRTQPGKSRVTLVGYMPRPRAGELLRVSGVWEHHPKYGQQLRITAAETILPSTVDGIRSYLESGAVPGVGPRTAARLVAHFGDRTLEIIERSPESLVQVKGIGPQSAERITRSWNSRHALRMVMQHLQQNGLNLSFAAKLMRVYGDRTLAVLRDDPHRIASDIPRIGFTIVDTLLQNAGAAPDDPDRVKACLLHRLRESAEDGHTFVPSTTLAAQCENHHGIPLPAAAAALDALNASGEVVIESAGVPNEPAAVYLPSLHRAETGIARRIRVLLSVPVDAGGPDRNRIIETVLKGLAIALSAEQLAVLEAVLRHRMAVITGGPGTGKTTLIRSITAVFESMGQRVLLAAPTGRAARRLAEVTGRPAHTIHRVLGFNPSSEGFEHDRDNPLQADAVIIDEASMVDTVLMHHLLDAVHVTSRVVLVGDEFQLPSVGPGNVLSDIIRSGAVRTLELREIFRQARQSPIIVNAHRVRRGQPPELKPAEPPDTATEFYFIAHYRSEAVVDAIVELCKWRIPERFGFDPIDDIQVLAPMHRGVVGTIHLNQVLQKTLNPDAEALSTAGPALITGDKVMHLKNNYFKDVFNGDSGRVCGVDQKNNTISVNYDGRRVDYDPTEQDELSLAYAITVHKAQGSEYPVVILPLTTQHYPMLQRNLLYTAITRAKHLVILIGTPRALEIALQNDRPRQRLSGLQARLASSPAF